MSRRYCSVCGARHNNGSEGLCDEHLLEREAREREQRSEEADQLAAFLELDDEDKWIRVFEFMRSQGWND